MNTKIFINTSFEGIHCYPDAPDQVSFLRHPHRHMFYVYVEMDVKHDDREVEFIMLKRFVNNYISNKDMQKESLSCEMMCNDIIDELKKDENYGPLRTYKVIISEDQENGAIVEWSNFK